VGCNEKNIQIAVLIPQRSGELSTVSWVGYLCSSQEACLDFEDS